MLSIEYQSFKRKLVSSLIILILMYANRLFYGSMPKVLLNILIGISFTVILIFPKSKWTTSRLIIAASTVAIEVSAGLIWNHDVKLIYFLSIVMISISMQLSLSKSPIPGMAAMFVTAMLYIRFGSDNFFSILSFILFSIILFFLIRTRMQRNEMIELDKQHLKELQEAYDQLQEASMTAMQYAILEERTRIARDIHDAVGHSLTSLIVQMQALKFMVKIDPEKAEKSLEEMLAVARQGLNDIRISVHSLADDQSSSGVVPLKALLSRMESTSTIQYQFQSELNQEDINVEVYGILFRVLQEALTNIIRHSQATEVIVMLKKESNLVVLSIQDNGKLEKNQKVNEGFGLKVMRLRLEERGGQLKYSTVEPHGFKINAVIPQ
jgi:signal transduction histidine kinase